MVMAVMAQPLGSDLELFALHFVNEHSLIESLLILIDRFKIL